jgi:hypothetical protein
MHAAQVYPSLIWALLTALLQNITLGGTGKETGDRHPKIGANVLIGANATVRPTAHPATHGGILSIYGQHS